MKNINIFTLLHFGLVIYLVTVPFVSKNPDLLGLHVLMLVSIIIHWTLNNDACALTLMEQALFPESDREELFFQRLVGPVYTVKHTDVHKLAVLGLLLTAHKYAKYK